MPLDWIQALIGGALIGIAVSAMLVLSGRVTGISGIVMGVLSQSGSERSWRALFVFGLLLGGITLHLLQPQSLQNQLGSSTLTLIFAGLLVGFGSILGSGCTSGHGVCGISRLSPRSLIATGTFMTAGILTVAVIRFLGGAL